MSKFSESIKDAFYTPQETVDQFQTVANSILIKKWRGNGTVLDPCCGDGRLSNGLKGKVDQSDLPNDFLLMKPYPVDLVVMNPPFTLDKEFINHALLFSDVVLSILPMSWNKMSSQRKYTDEVLKLWVGECVDNHYILPDGSTRYVRCGIFLFKEAYHQVRPDEWKLFNSSTLMAQGVQWGCRFKDSTHILRTKGTRAGGWITKTDKFKPQNVVYLKVEPGVVLPTTEQMRKIAYYTATIQNIDADSFSKLIETLNK